MAWGGPTRIRWPPQTTMGKEPACGSWWGLTKWWRGNMQWPWNLIGFYGWFSTSLHVDLNILTLLLSSVLSLSLCACISHSPYLVYFSLTHFLTVSCPLLYVCSFSVIPVPLHSHTFFFSNDERIIGSQREKTDTVSNEIHRSQMSTAFKHAKCDAVKMRTILQQTKSALSVSAFLETL